MVVRLPPSLRYSQLCSILRIRGVSPLKPRVSSAVLHHPPPTHPPCRETGSTGAAWFWSPAAAKDGPELRALMTPPRSSVDSGVVGPCHQSGDRRGDGKMIQIRTENHLTDVVSARNQLEETKS